MKKTELKYEDKPVYKTGEELYCIPEKRNVVIDEVIDGRDYSNQFRPDYKDGLVYDVLIEDDGYTGYHWWDFEPKRM